MKAKIGRNDNKKGMKGLMIFLIIVAAVILLGILARIAGIGLGNEKLSGADSVRKDFIGVLFVEGTIMEGGDTYSHEYALDAIDGMINNDKNKALMLYIDSPGGGVYESDELYLKIMEYKQSTGRPVYTYMGNQATSGGYYIAAPSDKIVANRNCWTGSIGVTIGNLYDITGLLDRYGIKVTTITSGKNKAMGDMASPLTGEQREIFQSLVDDAYDQFVAIVADGRKLDEYYVRKVADGRIYTASQAKDLKLIDDVVKTYDEALDDMKKTYKLKKCEVNEFQYEPEYGLLTSLLKSVDSVTEAISEKSDIAVIKSFMDDEGNMPLEYMCEVRK